MPNVYEQIDTYQDTVWALLAFHHELTWDDGNRKVLAESTYKARHTEEISLSDGSKITPDIHLAVPAGLPLGDIKMSFAKDGDARKKKEIED